jgi:protein phosphatase
LLREEHGVIGNLNMIGRLIRMKPLGEALIVGDLHGDLESLIDILKSSNFLQRMNQNDDAFLVFLGDYGDRGAYSVEVYYTVLKLKLSHPKQVALMRGNHEQFWVHGDQDDLAPSPHDLPLQFQAKFGGKWNEAYGRIRELFENLYTALLVEERYLMVHGGLPEKAGRVEDLAYAHTSYPKDKLLEDMLWSDPEETIIGAHDSPRGAGKLFGESITDRVLGLFNVKILVRGHEPCEEGFKISHHGKILTLFSRKGSPYFNTYGAYLDVELSRRFENAEQLVPFIHKF